MLSKKEKVIVRENKNKQTHTTEDFCKISCAS